MYPPFDALETRSQDAREADLFGALPSLVQHAIDNAPAYATVFKGIDPDTVNNRAALAKLPVRRKSALPTEQAMIPPFGGYATVPPGEMSRLFASPGPIFEAEEKRHDHWRFARALHASGFMAGSVVQNCFAYHFTPAGAMFEAGLHRIGCAVIPAGAGNTDQQARVMAALAPTGYVGTPDFLKLILEKADALGLDCTSTKRAHVTGGPYLPDLRQFYESREISVFQSYGTAELGLVAYQTGDYPGLTVAEDAIVEIVRPGTGDPVPEGEVGEVVVTVFNRAVPLIRFATGDLSAIMPGPSPCGRTNIRLRGWMGRADQTTKVKGQFVRPEQIAEIAKRHPELGRLRLIVDSDGGLDTMTLAAECADADIAGSIADSLKAVTGLSGKIRIEAPGGLANDGKVIDDVRRFD